MKKVGMMAMVTAFCGVASAGLLIEMDMNTTNGNQSLVNRGSITATGAFVSNGTYSATYAPVNGAGYSGDFSVNKSSVDMGDLAGADQLQSFTLCAWVNLSLMPTQARHVFSDITSLGGGNYNGYFFDILANTGTLVLRVDNLNTTSTGAIGTNVWTFIAATYDGTLTADNVKIYAATNGASLASIGSGSINSGAVNDNTANLYLGGSPLANNQNVPGLADNFRIYGSTTDASGVLSMAELQTVMGTPDVIPEPATVGMMVLGAAAVFLFRRRMV